MYMWHFESLDACNIAVVSKPISQNFYSAGYFSLHWIMCFISAGLVQDLAMGRSRSALRRAGAKN